MCNLKQEQKMSDFMKVVYGLTHTDLEIVWGSALPTASQKGYPKIFDSASYWVLYDGDTVVAYTTHLKIEGVVLVGNTYIRKEYRSKGLHTYLLSQRNNSAALKGFTKITVLNPIEDSQLKNLIKVVSKLGYEKVEKIGDISPNISDELFIQLTESGKQVWRC